MKFSVLQLPFLLAIVVRIFLVQIGVMLVFLLSGYLEDPGAGTFPFLVREHDRSQSECKPHKFRVYSHVPSFPFLRAYSSVDHGGQ